MKKIFIWMFAAILSCGLTTVVTSCDDDDVEDVMETINMVGKWTGSAQVSPIPSFDLEITFEGITTFNSDYTYTSVDVDGITTTGKWSLIRQSLRMTETVQGQEISHEFKIQDGWTRNRVVMTTTIEDLDENNKPISYTLTITLNRVDK